MSEVLGGFEEMGNVVDNVGERHIACVLLVDTSGSMAGASINELNQGLLEFGNALDQDEHARGVADVCVISFNSNVETVVPFCPAANYSAPTLSAGGLTSMNEAVIAGLDAIEERKQLYRQLGCSYYRPWMFLLTDGEPTDQNMEGLKNVAGRTASSAAGSATICRETPLPVSVAFSSFVQCKTAQVSPAVMEEKVSAATDLAGFRPQPSLMEVPTYSN